MLAAATGLGAALAELLVLQHLEQLHGLVIEIHANRGYGESTKRRDIKRTRGKKKRLSRRQSRPLVCSIRLLVCHSRARARHTGLYLHANNTSGARAVALFFCLFGFVVCIRMYACMRLGDGVRPTREKSGNCGCDSGNRGTRETSLC